MQYSVFNLFCGGGVLPTKWGLGFWHCTPTLYNGNDIQTEINGFAEKIYCFNCSPPFRGMNLEEGFGSYVENGKGSVENIHSSENWSFGEISLNFMTE